MQKHDAIDSDEDKLRLVFSQDKLALDACCLDLQKLWSSAQSVARLNPGATSRAVCSAVALLLHSCCAALD